LTSTRTVRSLISLRLLTMKVSIWTSTPCGAWLAMTGAHPKVIQSVMRHSSITLTMDTYGHLFPGQEADAVARLPLMLGELRQMQATGTDGP